MYFQFELEEVRMESLWLLSWPEQGSGQSDSEKDDVTRLNTACARGTAADMAFINYAFANTNHL